MTHIVEAMIMTIPVVCLVEGDLDTSSECLVQLYFSSNIMWLFASISNKNLIEQYHQHCMTTVILIACGIIDHSSQTFRLVMASFLPSVNYP